MRREERDSIGRILRWMSVLAAMAVLLKVYYDLKLLDLFVGVFKLEGQGKRIARVNQKTLMYIVRKGTDDNLFIRKMERMGWTFVAAYGRGYLFDKEGEEILVTKRSHLRYTIYEIQNRPFFMEKTEKLV